MDEWMIQTLGVALGLGLTLMIYSYLLGDNPLYRLAVHLLVGVGMGYASVVIIFRVLYPQLIAPLIGGAGQELQLEVLLLALLALFLLLKLLPQTAVVGNLAMGFVIGVGAAVAVAGAIMGTLLPQISATALSLQSDVGSSGFLEQILAALVIIAGTITSLLYFNFGATPVGDGKLQRPGWVRFSAQIGQIFLMITFGSLFAGALIASLSVFTERMQFYFQWLSQWL
jgi:hypothetical protein